MRPGDASRRDQIPALVGLDPDGVVGLRTFAALNVQSVAGGLGMAVPPVLTVGEPIWVIEGRRKLVSGTAGYRRRRAVEIGL